MAETRIITIITTIITSAPIITTTTTITIITIRIIRTIILTITLPGEGKTTNKPREEIASRQTQRYRRTSCHCRSATGRTLM